MAIDPKEFRTALSRFASGVTVVTTKDAAGNLHGITVTAFCSVSLQPPLVLVCIEKTTGSHYALQESGVFAVNILNETQRDVSQHFASQFPNKFEGVDFQPGRMGVPVLESALAVLECSLVNSHEGGDHTIFVGEVEHATVRDARALLYFNGNYRATPV